MPVGEWIKGQGSRLGPLVAAQPGIAEIADPAKVRLLFANIRRWRQGFAAWKLLFYALWHRRHILGAAAGGRRVPDPGNAMSDRAVLLRDIGVNAGLPYATYLLLSYEGVPTVQALAAGAVFPVASIIYGFVRERRVQALGMIVLVATVASILATLYFTSPYFVLAKGSLFTGSLGLLMLGSLFARRPLVFHLAIISADTEDRAEAERMWETEPPLPPPDAPHHCRVGRRSAVRGIAAPDPDPAAADRAVPAAQRGNVDLLHGADDRMELAVRRARDGPDRCGMSAHAGMAGEAISCSNAPRLLHSIRNDRLLTACGQSKRHGEKKMPAHFDLLIRNGNCVLPWGIEATDVGVRGGRIAALGVGSGATADATIDANGLHVLPGLIDPHVHLRDPGDKAVESIPTGTRAAVLGGLAAVFDMPNTSPSITDAERLAWKQEYVEQVMVRHRAIRWWHQAEHSGTRIVGTGPRSVWDQDLCRQFHR